MSSSYQKISKLSVGPGSSLSLPGINLLATKSTYETITGLSGLVTDLVTLSTNQSSGSGVAYGLTVGATEAGAYYGVSAEPTAARVRYLSSTGGLELKGKDVVVLDTTNAGYVNAVKDLNTEGDFSIGTYGGSDLGTITKSGTFASARTFTLPDLSGTFILDAGTQNIGGDKTFTGTVSAPTPLSSTQVATKGYVDAVATGLDFKESVRLVSVSNLALSGVAPFSIDGVTVADEDRILLAGQTDGTQNGIYDVTISGLTYSLARSADADTSAKVTSGMYAYIEEGTAGAGFSYVLSTPNPIVLGTTSLTFAIFNQAYTYTAGNGLQLVGVEFSVTDTIATDSFEAAVYVQTPSIQPATPGGTITFNSADLTGVDALSATSAIIPTLNATGATTLGNVASAMSIAGSSIGLNGDTSVSGELLADNIRLDTDVNQIVLGSHPSNHLTFTADTSALSGPKTYTVPISGASTATFPIVEGSPAASSEYILQAAGAGHIATWVASAPVESVRATLTTTSTSPATLATLATDEDRFYLAKLFVVAKRASNNEIATYEFTLPVKNVAGTLTIGSPSLNTTAYDSTFTGEEITFDASSANFRVRVTPVTTSSIVWKAHLSYHYVD